MRCGNVGAPGLKSAAASSRRLVTVQRESKPATSHSTRQLNENVRVHWQTTDRSVLFSFSRVFFCGNLRPSADDPLSVDSLVDSRKGIRHVVRRLRRFTQRRRGSQARSDELVVMKDEGGTKSKTECAAGDPRKIAHGARGAVRPAAAKPQHLVVAKRRHTIFAGDWRKTARGARGDDPARPAGCRQTTISCGHAADDHNFAGDARKSGRENFRVE